MRDVCWDCFKPRPHCICASIVPVENRTGIFVLQHPRERFHPIGTVRFARLGLRNVTIDAHFPRFEGEAAMRDRLPRDLAVLFPGPGAVDLGDAVAAGRAPANLLVLDGTWGQARTLRRVNGWLQGLPQVSVEPAAPTRYRIRKPPKPHCVSTLEAIVAALRILEPKTRGLDGLLAAFEAMIDRQARFLATNPRFRVRRYEPPERRVPPAFGDELGRLVVVHGEYARDTGGDAELFHLVAARADGSDALATWLRPARANPSDARVRAMGGRPGDLEAAPDRSELARRWRGFARPGDRLATWRPIVLGALYRELAQELATSSALSRSILLKGAYCNYRRRTSGSPSDVLAEEALDPVALPLEQAPRTDVPERPRRVLGELLAVARFLHATRRSFDADPHSGTDRYTVSR